ncbi:MAG: T9SS type A sorting domain-containing protein [Sphingobacteriales bacterium]|nr:MAG: T9SS type A sorting domain-containing protein [Sphingobacteriales bacterium]
MNKNKSLVFLLFAVLCRVGVQAQQTVFICNGETRLLTASSTGAVSYQWYKDGVPVSGAVSDTLTVDEAATFTVKALSDFGCTSFFSDDVFVRIKNPNSLNDSVTVNAATQIMVLLNDTAYCSPFDLSTLSIVQFPLKGAVSVLENGSLLYMPDQHVTGTDSFKYTINDQDGNAGNLATVYITLEVLPSAFIDLYSFTADLVNRNVLLKWACEKTELLSRIEIERSNNNTQWLVIGIQQPNDTGDYAFLDYMPPFGANFYRTKLLSTDGDFVYSDVRQVFIPGDKDEVRIYPNPTQRELTIEMPYNAGMFIQLMGKSGKVLKSLNTKEHYIKLDLGAFASGVYMLRLTDRNGSSKSYRINKI